MFIQKICRQNVSKSHLQPPFPNSSNALDSRWRLEDNGTYVRVYDNQDAMAASEGESSDTGRITDSGWLILPNGTYVHTTASWSSWSSTKSFQQSSSNSSDRSSNGTRVQHTNRARASGSSALDPSSEVVETNGGQWVWSDLSQKWEWVAQDNRGLVEAPDDTFARRTYSWGPWSSTSSSSRYRYRSSSSALVPRSLVEPKQGLPETTTRCEDYEELSSHCNNVGTYNCAVCQHCPSNYFGTNCECSAEEIPFGFHLEDGCRWVFPVCYLLSGKISCML